MTAPFWVSAFLDFPADDFDRGVAFWQAVTGYSLSERRGVDGEFATLVPPAGDDYLRVQRLGDGPGRVHLDLHVPDPSVAAEAVVELGGRVRVRHESGYVVVRSPGGLVFCLVRHEASERPRQATWPDGNRSLVDQVCVDMPPELHDREAEFWRSLTGWELTASPASEFSRLRPPDSMPLKWLLQRLDDPGGPVSVHLDLACDDRDAEIARHETLGASVLRRHEGWTVMTDPVGTTYCITGRKP